MIISCKIHLIKLTWRILQPRLGHLTYPQHLHTTPALQQRANWFPGFKDRHTGSEQRDYVDLASELL